MVRETSRTVGGSAAAPQVLCDSILPGSSRPQAVHFEVSALRQASRPDSGRQPVWWSKITTQKIDVLVPFVLNLVVSCSYVFVTYYILAVNVNDLM